MNRRPRLTAARPIAPADVAEEIILAWSWIAAVFRHPCRTVACERVARPTRGFPTTWVRDLENSGRLDRTLIVPASEFSRDMMTEGKPVESLFG